MAPTRDRIKALYLALETGGFGVDPSSNGSGYTAIKTTEIGFPVDQTEVLQTNFMTGRARVTKAEIGRDGAQLDFTVPISGLAASVGDGASPAAADYLGLILNHIFGASTLVDGEGLSGANAGDVSLDTDTVLTDPFDLAPIWESGVNDDLVQWRRTLGGTSPYTVHRNFDDTPSGSGVAYGHHLWIHADRPTRYTLLGGAITSAVLTMQAGQIATLKCTAMFDSKTQTSKASIPAITSGTISAVTPIQGELASVEFAGTEYAASSVEIDLGLNVVQIQSIAGSNARSGMVTLDMSPKIKFTPQFQTALETAFRAGTTGKAMVRFGAGTVSGGVMNSMAVYTELAQIMEPANASSDGGLVRQSVSLSAIDAGLDGSGNAYPYLLIGRA